MNKWKSVNIKLDVEKDKEIIDWLEDKKIKKTIVALIKKQMAFENAFHQAEEFEKFMADAAEQVNNENRRAKKI